MIFALALFSSAASAFDGPLQVRNQFPLFLPADAPYTWIRRPLIIPFPPASPIRVSTLSGNRLIGTQGWI